MGSMPELETGIETDAQRLTCSILSEHDHHGWFRGHRWWPWADQINNLSAYKKAKDKRATIRYMLDHGWLEIDQCETAGVEPVMRRRYVITDIGRAVVTCPDPLPGNQD